MAKGYSSNRYQRRNNLFYRHGWTLAGLLLVVLLSGGYAWSQRGAPATEVGAEQSAELKTFRDTDSGITFKYPTEELAERALTPQEVADKTLVHLTGKQSSVVVTLQAETGLSKVSALLKREPFDIVLENSAKVLPTKYAGYKLVDERRFEQDGRKAAELIFTYTGNGGVSVRQRLLIVLRDRDTAYYLTGQTKASEYAKLNSSALDPIFKSVKF